MLHSMVSSDEMLRRQNQIRDSFLTVAPANEVRTLQPPVTRAYMVTALNSSSSSQIAQQQTMAVMG
jgi:hypothetical protein